MLPHTPSHQAFLMQREIKRQHSVSDGAQRTHDSLPQHISPRIGMRLEAVVTRIRRMDVTGKRGGRHLDEQSCRARVEAKSGGGDSFERAEPVGNFPAKG
jgi:hypothetical protein